MPVPIPALAGQRVLLVITGGIAAYKSLDLIRRLREVGASVRCVLTRGGEKFVTPLSVAALSGEPVQRDLFSLTDEADMGHIRLARETDLVVVAPASADFLARMAQGYADDLATAVLLATSAPVIAAPGMNTHMWSHSATQRNISILTQYGVQFVGPVNGDLACGEVGLGRMVEPNELLVAVQECLAATHDQSLTGLKALVTSGPTHEAIDPVRYMGNVSSGKQGHAIAAALARRGSAVVLVSGPTSEPDPPGVKIVRVESARDMLASCEAALPVDVAICAAAVSDWRVADPTKLKVKKNPNAVRTLALVENPDILASLAQRGSLRPRLVIGFAAETEPDRDRLIAAADTKLTAKGCDWILANDVSPDAGTFGGTNNTVHLVTSAGTESWPAAKKTTIADRIAGRVAAHLAAEAPAA